MDVMFLFGLILSAFDPSLVLKEPIAPVEVSLSLTTRCATDTTLQISGMGYVRPEGREPTIMVDGRLLEGEAVEAIKQDLSDPSAIYRLVVRCHQGEPGIWLVIYAAKLSDQEISYKAASATIVDGKVERYHGLETIDQGSFWFE